MNIGENNDMQISFRDMRGFIKTQTATPTYVPNKLEAQVKIVGTKLYIYETISNSWKFASLT